MMVEETIFFLSNLYMFCCLRILTCLCDLNENLSLIRRCVVFPYGYLKLKDCNIDQEIDLQDTKLPEDSVHDMACDLVKALQ